MTKPFIMPHNKRGFTLIEVLVALLIIAIAFTALLKASAQNVVNTERIKEKSIHHWVAMQAVTAIQLGLIPLTAHHETSEVTTMFNQRWYWRAKLSTTPIKAMQKITITIANKPNGPFGDPLIAFRYTP